MTERSVTHATFTVERSYKAAPAKVFAHWADADLKKKWFASPEEVAPELELDFRVGGIERGSGIADGGRDYVYQARYDDIVPGERIVYSYTMDLGGLRISSSLGTVVLAPDGAGTRLTYTEQGVYLDGNDTPEGRKHGTEELFDQLKDVVDG